MSTDAWLELPAEPQAAPTPPKRKRGRPPKTVSAGKKLTKERLRAPSMQRRLYGRDRIWACDGEYVYFRPTKMIDGVKTVVANPTTYARHKDALARGHIVHVETQDDVEIYKVSPDSPFARRGLYLGEMPDHQVRRQVAVAACRREWPLYVDALEELAGRIKNRGYDPAFHANVWRDQLAYIDILISMRGGPSPAECGRELQAVRMKRGESRGRLIVQM